MMKLQCAFEAGRRRPWLSRPNGEGGGAVAFAAAAPLIVLAVAVAADHAHVSRFRTQVQLAAGAASLAAAGAIARHPEISGDSVGARVASAVFARNAPRGASGTLSVAATSTAPSEASPTAKRMTSPSPPRRVADGVMPSRAVAVS